MLPSRFKALNSDESEESDSNEAPAATKEALEQRAISQYQVALQLQHKEEWEPAEKILRELLKSDVISQACGKILNGGHSQSSLVHLKYCISINLGHCLTKQKKLEKALKYYLKASKIDNSDLNLWFRMGNVATKVGDLSLAVSAFEEALRCSPNHWPSIDNLVTVTYALGDYMSCLFYISKGLNMDNGFMKGHAFKEKIFSLFPSLIKGFPIYYPQCNFPSIPSSENQLSKEDLEQFFEEAEILKNKENDRWKPSEIKPADPLRPDYKVKLDTWVNIAKCLLYLHEMADPQKVAFSSVKFSPEQPSDENPIEIEDLGSEDEQEDIDEKNNLPEDEDEQGRSRVNGNLMERLVCSQKRRSARVRSTVRREEPSLAEAFKKLIPFHLLPLDPKKEGEGLSDELDTMDLYRLFELKDNTENEDKSKEKKIEKERDMYIEEEGYFWTIKERTDVEFYIKEAERSENNIFDTMQLFLIKLSRKWKLHWPDLLGQYYIEINMAVLRYYPPTVIINDGLRTFHDDVNVLLFGELLLNEWLEKGKRKDLPSPLGNSPLGGEFCSLNLGKLNYRASTTDDVEFIARSYWLEALLFLHCGDTEAAVRALEQILDEPRCETICLKVPNVSHNSMINCKIALTLLKGLKRNKSLGQVVSLYNSSSYDEVSEILSDSLTVDPESSNTDTISRSMQYALILDSYWKLGKFDDCIFWTECSLYETFGQYRNAGDEERQEYAQVIVSTLQGLHNLIEKNGSSIFKALPNEKLTRIVQSLSSIINHQVAAPENTTEMPIESVLPWIILSYILRYDEEQSGKVSKIVKEDEEEELPSYIQILFQGHEYLGRRSWCCFDEGALLFHTLDALYPFTQNLPPESQNLLNVNQQVDQIFYCLYGIQKKNKIRNLQDHKVLGLALTWNRAQQVFTFTRPRELPSYDSVGKCCMTADNEALFLKLIKHVPDNCNPSRLLSQMNKYIDGELDEVPRNDCPLPYEIADIYFLLAHFYYKAKSWGKVWQYHLLDVCANPGRYASWAGLALSRGTEIETKLNSCETIKNEGHLLSLASTVCRCYKKSLELEHSQITLWIERGTFSYTIHSFCSNVLKKEQNLSIEMYSTLEEQKESMLEAAYQCFLSANKIWHDSDGKDLHDERWLHHYMFGKISRKKDEDPTIYINHYLKSAALLHEIGANYPILITYNNPQPLAVEALELFYRVHVCIMKSLDEASDRELPTTTMEIFKQAVTVLSQSPFVTQVKEFLRQEKPKKIVPRKTDSSSEEELPVSKDVQDMIQDILVKVESDHSSSNPLKRKLSAIEEEPAENESPAQKSREASADADLVDAVTALTVTDKGAASSSTSETAKEKQHKSGEESTTTTSDSQSSSSDSASDSSNSSSDSSSLSDSSSSSSSSSSSDSSGSGSEPPAKKAKLKPELAEVSEEGVSEREWLYKKCVAALELCKKRFPEHYKSTYHLAHFFLKSKTFKNNEKVKDLLLGATGLFAERKPTNFFNGIWRIPNGEIDRPGSFAAHMGRSTLLLLEFLRETNDYGLLFDLALHLKITPEADKKYIRDGEREELSREAATLCVQVLRKKIPQLEKEELSKFILEIYSMHRRAYKSNLPKFSSVLTEAYLKLTNNQGGNEGATLDNAVRYCIQQIHLERQQANTPQQIQTNSMSLPPASTPPTNTQAPSQPTQQIQQPPQLQVQSQTQQQVAAPASSATPSSLSSPASSQESTPLPGISAPTMGSVARRGARTGTTRKPRGRPPGSTAVPRLPRGMSVSTYVSFQNELLRHYSQQNAELARQLAAQSVSAQGQASTPSGSSVLKDRPSLSITPLKATGASPVKPPSATSPVKQTPVNTASPISVSVSRKTSSQYKPRKPAPPSPAPTTQWTPSGQPFRPPSISIQPIPPPLQPPLQKSATQEVTLQHKILSAKKNLSTPPAASSSPATTSLGSTMTSSAALASNMLSITPNTLPSAQGSFTITPNSVSITPSAVSIIPTSVSVTTPLSITPATAMAPSQLKKPPELPFHPSNELTVRQITPKLKSNFNVRTQPATSRKEVVNSISIIPTTKIDQQKVLSSRMAEEKAKLSSKVASIDSSVADALRNFGSSITITTTNKKPTVVQDEMSIIPVTQPKPKNTKDPCEVIVLDD